MELTGGEAVVSALEMLGVRHVFGIVSVHNLPIYDAIARRGTITPIAVRHEQARSSCEQLCCVRERRCHHRLACRHGLDEHP